MPKLPSLLELLQAGVHFGHQKSKWHPSMEQFIFAERNGVHIIDLEQTQVQLEHALEFIKNTVAAGGVLLFVGTKDQAKPIVEAAARSCGMPYVTRRWLGGTLTNFAVISKLIKKYKDLKSKQETGALRGYTKKEQLDFQTEIADMELRIGGISELKRIPEAVFVIDIKREKTAVAEAARRGVPIVALCDSNVNPKQIAHVIPGNDDATKGIELVTTLVAEAVKEGKVLADAAKQKETAAKEKADRSTMFRTAAAAKPAATE